MEALSTFIVAPFKNYDICKAIDSEMVMDEVKLSEKSGSKSGEWVTEK